MTSARSRIVSLRALRLTAHACLILVLAPELFAGAFTRTLTRAEQLERGGQFLAAETLLRQELARPGLSETQRQQLEFERERLSRLRREYRLTSRELLEALAQSVNGLTAAEFDRWISEGRFDGRRIDGTMRFANASARNLFFRYPDLAARRLAPPDTLPEQRAYLENALAIQGAARASHQPYVLPKRFEIKMTVLVAPNTAPTGQVIRAWLPVPRQYPFQGPLQLLDSSSTVRQLAPAQSAIRSAYLEQPAEADGGAVFWLKYAFTAQGVSFDLDPDRVHRRRHLPPDLRPFVAEAPHVVFTEPMRQLAWEIAGYETNPLLKAKKFYDWVSDHIQYSFAPEYSTIRNLGERCLSRRYGDCGMEALVFITLCRVAGIPARWQSGWTIFPGAEDIHDWCEIHLDPYGWVPVDPYMGIYAKQCATGLQPDERRQLRDFYFGGVSQYRVTVNSDHCQNLVPPKRSFRSDPVDFQRGELETEGRNLYFDRFDYILSWEETPLTAPK